MGKPNRNLLNEAAEKLDGMSRLARTLARLAAEAERALADSLSNEAPKTTVEQLNEQLDKSPFAGKRR